MPIAIDFEKIAEEIGENSLILTPNARTQKAVIAGFVSALSEGEVVYAPKVNAFAQWQNELWRSLAFIQPLPGIVDSLVLKNWLKATIAEDAHWQLTNELGVAEKVLEAYRVLSQWGLTLSEIKDSIETPESRYFIKWVSQLEQFLKQKNLLPQFLILRQLAGRLPELSGELPDKILLVGFNQLTPIEESFLAACKKLGTQYEKHYPKRLPEAVDRVQLDDFNHELTFAAKLSLKISQKQPQASTAVVVNQLASHLNQVHQIFTEQFQAQASFPWRGLDKAKYNVSAGTPLFEIPIVFVAYSLLAMGANGIDLATLRLLKNTPFIAWGEHSGYIREFIHQQCLLTRPRYCVDDLIQSLDANSRSAYLQVLKQRLNALRVRLAAARPIKAWVDLWKNQLMIWQWGEVDDDRQADEIEQRLIAEFDRTLSDCLMLATLHDKCTLSQAQEFLLQLLKTNTFQVPSDRTEVHVLGVLEATGIVFDNLILVGFNRDNWPQKARLNPFLPVLLQKKQNMPGASAEREYDYAQDLSRSLLAAANQIWITQSCSGDEQVSPESPCFSCIDLSPADNHVSLFQKNRQIADYEWISDNVIDLSVTEISGGAYLLSQYADCPFKAMANFQFKIRVARQLNQGIDPRIRGAWLHRAMELFWLKLKTQQALLDLSLQARQALIHQVLRESHAEYAALLLANTLKEVVECEYEKLFLLIDEWVALELKRQAFVCQLEVEKSLHLSGIDFKLRIDRIDINQRGEFSIIDYKTGSTDVRKWLGQRPTEAQMPAYVLACEQEPLRSLSYARLKTGEVARQGIWFAAEKEGGSRFLDIGLDATKDKTKRILANDGLVDNDASLVVQWKKNLTDLASKIAGGEMPVSPKQLNDSCRYCDFAEFCRIAESQPGSNKQ